MDSRAPTIGQVLHGFLVVTVGAGLSVLLGCLVIYSTCSASWKHSKSSCHVSLFYTTLDYHSRATRTCHFWPSDDSLTNSLPYRLSQANKIQSNNQKKTTTDGKNAGKKKCQQGGTRRIDQTFSFLFYRHHPTTRRNQTTVLSTIVLTPWPSKLNEPAGPGNGQKARIFFDISIELFFSSCLWPPGIFIFLRMRWMG